MPPTSWRGVHCDPAIEDGIERFLPREWAVLSLRLPPAAARIAEDVDPYGLDRFAHYLHRGDGR